MSDLRSLEFISIMVIGDGCYGVGTSVKEAYDRCRQGIRGRLTKYLVYIVPPGTYLDGIGDFIIPPDGFRPVKIDEKGLK